MFAVFDDIDKSPKDLLKKDFLKKTGLTLKLKNKAPNGIKVDTTIEDLNKQSFASSVSTSYAHSSGFSVDKFELTGKQGKIVTETSISGAAPGLTLEFKGDTKSAGDLSATYEAPSFTATGGMDIVDFKSADASVCSGSGPLTFGAALKLALPSGSSAFSLSDYSVGASYKAKPLFAAAVFSDSFAKADVSSEYTLSCGSKLAGVLNYPANTITVGGSYACNPKTTIKAKVNSCGDVNASVKQAVAKDCSLVGMASVKASDLSKSGTAAIKFGGSITLG